MASTYAISTVYILCKFITSRHGKILWNNSININLIAFDISKKLTCYISYKKVYKTQGIVFIRFQELSVSEDWFQKTRFQELSVSDDQYQPKKVKDVGDANRKWVKESSHTYVDGYGCGGVGWGGGGSGRD